MAVEIAVNSMLTTMLGELQESLIGVIDNLKPVAVQILGVFFIFEVLIKIVNSNPNDSPLSIWINKFKTYFWLYMVIWLFPTIMSLVEKMFDYFYTSATSDTTVTTLKEIPQTVIDLGFKAFNSLYDGINNNSGWLSTFGFVSIIMLIIGIIILIIFAKVAITICMVVIEYMVMSSLFIILVPFMMFEKLRFVGDKVIGTLINLQMKIFVIRFLLYFFAEYLKQPMNISGLEGTAVIQYGFYWTVVAGILALMMGKGSDMANTLISGVTNFGDSQELVGMARQGMGKTMSTLKAGYRAGTSSETSKGARQGATDGAISGVMKGGVRRATSSAIIGGLKGGIKGMGKDLHNHMSGR